MVPLLRVIWSLFSKWFVAFLPFLPWLTVFAVLLGGYVTISVNEEALISLINSAASKITSMPGGQVIGQVNRIFPLTELLAMEGTVLATHAIAGVIRIVKSFMPGFAS